MACLQKTLCLYCTAPVRALSACGKLVSCCFLCFSLAYIIRRDGRKVNDSLSKALQVHFKSGPNDMNVLCYCSEFINRLLLILFTWVEYHRREVGVIGRIGEVLSFKADATSSWEGSPMLSLVAVCPVVGVELHTWFGGINFHCATRCWFHYSCCET